MGRTHGVRRGTRYMFSVDYKKHGPTPLQKWFVNYKVGDIVDIKVSMASYCVCGVAAETTSPLSLSWVVGPRFHPHHSPLAVFPCRLAACRFLHITICAFLWSFDHHCSTCTSSPLAHTLPWLPCLVVVVVAGVLLLIERSVDDTLSRCRLRRWGNKTDLMSLTGCS
jgi:hypothetical protein